MSVISSSYNKVNPHWKYSNVNRCGLWFRRLWLLQWYVNWRLIDDLRLLGSHQRLLIVDRMLILVIWSPLNSLYYLRNLIGNKVRVVVLEMSQTCLESSLPANADAPQDRAKGAQTNQPAYPDQIGLDFCLRVIYNVIVVGIVAIVVIACQCSATTWETLIIRIAYLPVAQVGRVVTCLRYWWWVIIVIGVVGVDIVFAILLHGRRY